MQGCECKMEGNCLNFNDKNERWLIRLNFINRYFIFDCIIIFYDLKYLKNKLLLVNKQLHNFLHYLLKILVRWSNFRNFFNIFIVGGGRFFDICRKIASCRTFYNKTPRALAYKYNKPKETNFIQFRLSNCVF